MNVGSEYIKNLESQLAWPILIKISKNLFTLLSVLKTFCWANAKDLA